MFVQKAKEVTDKMAFAWVGVRQRFCLFPKSYCNISISHKDNNVPFGQIDFATNTPVLQGVEQRYLSIESS